MPRGFAYQFPFGLAFGVIGNTGGSILPLPNNSAQLAGNVALPAFTLTTIMTTAVLGVGKWLISFSAEISNGGAVAGDAQIDLAPGTATLAPFGGPNGADGTLVASGFVGLAFSCIVTVTIAGTVKLEGFSTVAGTALKFSTANGDRPTGYTAVQIA
jgi:hypothetical protein